MKANFGKLRKTIDEFFTKEYNFKFKFTETKDLLYIEYTLALNGVYDNIALLCTINHDGSLRATAYFPKVESNEEVLKLIADYNTIAPYTKASLTDKNLFRISLYIPIINKDTVNEGIVCILSEMLFDEHKEIVREILKYTIEEE